VRALVIGLALALATPAFAQAPAPKKKPAARQSVHRKATPEQIRKFNQLEKKQEAEPRKK
jgi:hypothetical protein